MSVPRTIGEAFAPWAGLVVGTTAWSTAHQFGADATFDDCGAFAPGPILAVAIIAILATALAGLLSWSAFRREGSQARRVIAVVSVGLAALFCLAIIYPILATLIIPPCFM